MLLPTYKDVELDTFDGGCPLTSFPPNASASPARVGRFAPFDSEFDEGSRASQREHRSLKPSRRQEEPGSAPPSLKSRACGIFVYEEEGICINAQGRDIGP